MNQHDDLHDRLLDCALSEVAGGHAPPDLSARILAAAENSVTPIKEIAMDSPKRTRRVWISLAVAACLLVGAGFLIPAIQRGQETARRAKQLTIAQGAFDEVESRGSSPSPYYLSDDVQHEPPAPVVNEPPMQPSGTELSVLSESIKPDTWADAEAAAPMVPQIAGKDGVVGFSPDNGAKQSGSAGQNQGVVSFGAIPGGGGRQTTWGHYGTNPRPWPGQEGSGQADVRYAPPNEQSIARMDARVFYDEARRKELRRSQELGEQLKQLEALAKSQGRGPRNSGDQYTRIYENPFIEARGEQAMSTFSIDVDTASYANVRQFLQSGQLPPPDAVRLEELINYFDYQYEPPASDSQTPFSAAMEVAGCPWEPKHRLVRIALQGRELENKKRPKSNLVFLIDVSGSMDEPNKLPLVIEGMKQLVRELGENDRVAMVVYASSEGLVLPSTPGTEQATILEALDRLQAGGSTAGGAGIQLAYQMAEDNFVQGGVNRVILCTDGDFNVGVTSTADLERMVVQKAKDTKVFLSVLGFGRGNLNDAMMETISNHGNGNYHYVDNLTEARKVLVEEMTGTLVTIAKDVKIQVEFNPAQVAGYRLLGYENRMLHTEDFNDDKKDAGEIGAGHRVTALYEIVPAGEKVAVTPVDDLKYQQPAKPGDTAADSKELLTLKLRYKQPDSDTSTKIEFPMTDEGKTFSAATPDFKFAIAVASFGMLLRNSEYKGNATFDAVLEIATEGAKHDPNGYRAEFLELVRKAKTLSGSDR